MPDRSDKQYIQKSEKRKMEEIFKKEYKKNIENLYPNVKIRILNSYDTPVYRKIETNNWSIQHHSEPMCYWGPRENFLALAIPGVFAPQNKHLLRKARQAKPEIVSRDPHDDCP